MTLPIWMLWKGTSGLFSRPMVRSQVFPEPPPPPPPNLNWIWKPRKWKRGICISNHFATTYGGELYCTSGFCFVLFCFWLGLGLFLSAFIAFSTWIFIMQAFKLLHSKCMTTEFVLSARKQSSGTITHRPFVTVKMAAGAIALQWSKRDPNPPF